MKIINQRPSLLVPEIIKHITSVIPIQEMMASRGKEYTKTGFYQIRVKPTSKAFSRNKALSALEQYFKTIAQCLGLSEITINTRSCNSSKFGSVSFIKNGINYDVVVARGANGGEVFEKVLIERMTRYIQSPAQQTDNQAKLAVEALEGCDPVFKAENIRSVEPRSGSTHRGKLLTETAHIIADMIITLKGGDRKFISVKNQRGSSVAQYGVSGAFNDDLTINVNSIEWQTWLQPFNLNIDKITKGLVASQSKKNLPWEDIDKTHIKVNKSTPIYKILEKMWGVGYYYLRELRIGFKAFRVDKNFVDSCLLKNLKVTEIRYPSKDRKQISVYLQSNLIKYKIEVRNPRGKGSARPTQIQLTIVNGVM